MKKIIILLMLSIHLIHSNNIQLDNLKCLQIVKLKTIECKNQVLDNKNSIFPSLSILANSSTCCQKLLFSGYYFLILPEFSFQKLRIHKLDLSWNNVELFKPLTFYGISNLMELKLNNNKIKDVFSLSYFLSLINLTHLDLSYNLIPRVSNSSFIGLDKLTFLDLSNNWINQIESDSFILHNLVELK